MGCLSGGVALWSRYIALHRSAARYQSHGGQSEDDAELARKIETIQADLPRSGVRRVLVRLRKSGERVNHKRVQRVIHFYKLQVMRRRSKKTLRTGVQVPGRAEYPDHVWTIDFQEGALINGRKARLSNLLDEFTRQGLAVVVGARASAKTVADALNTLFRERGTPAFLRRDNGGEFIEGNLADLLLKEKVEARFIDPSRPRQNGFIESFHSRLRDELLHKCEGAQPGDLSVCKGGAGTNRSASPLL